jgi:hypothetical protein
MTSVVGATRSTEIQFLEEIIPIVVDDDEGAKRFT